VKAPVLSTRILSVLIALTFSLGLFAQPARPVQALSPDIVISQIYGGGGNTGATYTHDFIELFNRGTSSVSLAGWSVQYASATGTGNFGATSAQITELPNISLAPGQYLLIQEAQGSGGTTALPTPDVIDPTPIAMSATGGKVALVMSTASLGCNGSSTPCNASQLALIKDLVGWDGANFYETSPAPATTNTTALLRNSNGCAETDNNALDFTAGAPTPRNTSSPLNPCAAPEPKINEFSASTVGTDVEYVEIFGAPNTDYSAYTVLEIEGDSGAATGTVDEVINIGTTDANSLYLVNLPANALENGTITLLLVKNFTGALNADLDTNNDGIFDTTPWDTIVDAVAVNDGGAGDLTYGVPSLGVSYDGLPFAPGGASRIPDGFDTDSATDWVRNDFDLAGIPGFTGTPIVGEALNTPGAPNQAITAETITVTIEATDGDAAEEGSNTGNFRISRSGSTTVALTVNYTLSGTASPADYTPALSGSIEIPAGAPFVDILITPVDDTEVEGPETLTLTLVGGTGYTLGAVISASITIADNDSAVVITPIHNIQGNGNTVIPGTFTVEAIVVGDYQTQGSGQLRGFFIQEEDADADADPATSEGIFVFCSSCPTAVNVGDKVRVTGASSDFFGMSQLSATTAASVSVLSSSNPLPTPATIELPVPGMPGGDLAAATAVINAYFEKFEGMLVTFPDTLSVSEYFELARYGQVILTEGGRPHTFTAANLPSAAGLIDHEINLASRTIILDDTDNVQNRPVATTPNSAYYHPVPGLSISNYFRGGDTITNLTGVLHWSFAGLSGTDAWRIRPVIEAYNYAFTPANPRPAPPSLSGNLKVASFNVLNYFLTIDTTASNDVGTCGPSGTADCRGADSAQELVRQRAKLTQALLGLDADIVGLIEMENTPGVTPQQQIVDDLNAIAGAGTYSYINTGVIGTDAIRVGMIYKPGKVTPVGNYAILDSTVDPRFTDTRNRPALAQTFQENTSGGRFTVVVNHLKSKGSACGVGDDDTTTGQGNCNLTRTLAAQALADWLATDPTGSGDPDVLIIGDLNSYAREDPIVALESAGYINMVAAFGGSDAYSYVFDGQLGYLDYALANPSLFSQTSGVTEWHINADEIPLFDYNDEVLDPGESSFEKESDAFPLYEANAYRTSDHDPVIVGLNLVNYPPELGEISVSPSLLPVGATVNASVPFSDPDKLDTHTAVWDWGDGSTSAGAVSESFGAGTITGDHIYTTTGVYTVQVTVQDNYGNSDTAVYQYVVVYDPNGGFVTGGGWIDSPAGAYKADPNLTGKANFGFVAKYQRGAQVPTGNTQFQFKAGDLNFHSVSYEWLVVAGSKAQFKGVGMINGQGMYKFMLTAIDGSPDRFRIKIWYEENGAEIVVYDNGNDQALGGGSITIHK
jgi:hypothetical protein